LQKWPTRWPGGFVVLGAFDALVREVFAELPTFLKEDVAKLFNVGTMRGLPWCDIEPDAGRARQERRREAIDHALIHQTDGESAARRRRFAMFKPR